MYQVQTRWVHIIALSLMCKSLFTDANVTDANDDQEANTLSVYNFSVSQTRNTNNAILTWKIENLDDHYPEDYKVYIEYQSGCDFIRRRLIINENMVRIGNENQFMYCFEKLCPNYENKITLFTNSTFDNLTIPSVEVKFMGLPREPFYSPIIDPGSFFIDDIGNLFVYWKRIDPTDYNGNNFKIQITNGHLQEPNDQTMWIATFDKDRFNTALDAKIKLLSSNDVGSATEASFIEIPSNDRLCGKPENIQVVALGGNYHVTWTEPIGDYDITSYTVFWCTSVSKSSTQCDSPIDFKRVNGTLQFNIKSSDRHLKFAVSANTDTTTSGMTWNQCIAKTDPALIGKIDTFQNTTISTNKIEFRLAPKCVDRLIVKNYKVSYCPVKDRNSDCMEKSKEQIINTTTYSINNLKPSTTYRIIVTMQSATTEGEPSIPQYVKTASPIWETFGIYFMLIVFVLVPFGISVYWSYFKLKQMKDIEVRLPFGLDLEKDYTQIKSYNQLIVPALSVSKERLSVILETETSDTASNQSSTYVPYRKISLQSQGSAETAVVQDDPIQVASIIGTIGNCIIHPVTNTESSPKLVHILYSDEQANNSDNIGPNDTHISSNGYVDLHTFATQVNRYTPMSRSDPPVIPIDGYVQMHTLALLK